MPQFDVAQLFGDRVKVEYPSTGEDPIRIWYEPPSDPLIHHLLAITGMADVKVGEDGKAEMGGSAGLEMYAKYKAQVAMHCIAGADNLDGWPEDCRKSQGSGWPCLNDAALKALGNAKQYILVDVGGKILDAKEVTEEQGNASLPQPTGTSTKTSGQSETAA